MRNISTLLLLLEASEVDLLLTLQHWLVTGRSLQCCQYLHEKQAVIPAWSAVPPCRQFSILCLRLCCLVPTVNQQQTCRHPAAQAELLDVSHLCVQHAKD